MARKLYFGRPWDEPGYPDSWISFEDNPDFSLTQTKSKFCQQCLLALKKGLLSYQPQTTIDLGPGADCWQAVIGIEGCKNPHEAKRFLEDNQDDFLPAKTRIHGKVGGGDMPGQQQIIMQADSPIEARVLKESMKSWLQQQRNHLLNSYYTEQGCRHPFLELFGAIAVRNRNMEPASPQAVHNVLELYLQDSTIASFDPVQVRRRKTHL